MYEKNALNNFKDVLGKYCAINQFVELSKRCFLVEHQNEIQKRDTFVKLATEYAVTLTNYDADSMVCEICRSYIVNVHLCFETFLKDVCRQINKYGKNEYKPRIQEESYLSCAVRNICGNNLSDDMKPFVNDYRIHLVEARKNNLKIHNIDNKDLFNLLEILLNKSGKSQEIRQRAIDYARENKVEKNVIMTVAGAANCKMDYN